MGGDPALTRADRRRHLALVQPPDHVAGREDVRHTRPKLRVDLDLAPRVHGDPGGPQTDLVDVWAAARRDQQLLRPEGAPALADAYLGDDPSTLAPDRPRTEGRRRGKEGV